MLERSFFGSLTICHSKMSFSQKDFRDFVCPHAIATPGPLDLVGARIALSVACGTMHHV